MNEQEHYSGTHEESEKMKCFYLDHNSTTNSPIAKGMHNHDA